MPREGLIRRKNVVQNESHTSASSSSKDTAAAEDTSQDADRPTRSWRFYVRWAARIAIPIVLMLSNARVVRISDPTPPSISQSSALLIIAHSRHAYLSRCLTSVLKYHSGNGWPVIVSMDRQDGDTHEEVADVVELAARNASLLGVDMLGWAHELSYEQDIEQGEGFVDNIAYRRISRHYEWALRRVFTEGAPGYPSIERVVIVEDDMEIAPDFFHYFEALTPLLEQDKSLFCISAWNDNGIEALARSPEQLHRTDFFPGLGWMLTRSLWGELEPKWPKMFWDDWMRSNEQTKGRQCIRPEVSRTANFGEEGVSQSFHFNKHISKVVLAKTTVNFSALDLTYLKPDRYHHYVFSRMSKAVQLRFSNYLTSRPQDGDVIAFYPDGQMEAIGKRTGIMVDHRNGVRRTSYQGVVIIPWNGHWAFLVKRGWNPPEGYQLGERVCC